MRAETNDMTRRSGRDPQGWEQRRLFLRERFREIGPGQAFPNCFRCSHCVLLYQGPHLFSYVRPFSGNRVWIYINRMNPWVCRTAHFEHLISQPGWLLYLQRLGLRSRRSLSFCFFPTLGPSHARLHHQIQEFL